ncbi:MAG: hypothetical protein FWF69_06390 [Firmicutes bacterium]|nr:hypothetical protein [Bacillota bacterium]
MRDRIVVVGADVPSGRAVAKKLRAQRYCCTLLASGATAGEIARLGPAGVVLAGEAQDGALLPDAGLLTLGVPVLALGSCARALLCQLGFQSDGDAVENAAVPVTYMKSPLFEEVAAGERWVTRAEPFAVSEPYRPIADGAEFPLAFASDADNVFLLQFHIERNDPDGMAMLRAFADIVCGCEPWWTVENIVADAEKAIREAAGDGEAICAISGGLDSTVAAMLAARALGDRVRCVFVDTGLFRRGEVEEAERYFREELHLNFLRVDARRRILRALAELTEARDKWRVVEEEITAKLGEEARGAPGVTVFVKGTQYLDVLGTERRDQVWQFPPVVEPLRELFKEEIRMIGEFLSLSPALLSRQPFPGMGLASRIQGAVDAERLEVLRAADTIFREVLAESGQGKRLSRYFAVLSQIDGHDAVILRATQGEELLSAARLPHDLLERIVERILRELPSVRRVLYDMTPGMERWG